MKRPTYAVNHIFRFCFQIGKEFPENTDDDNEKGIELQEVSTNIKTTLSISESMILPEFDFSQL
jgi:hypothetical protein